MMTRNLKRIVFLVSFMLLGSVMSMLAGQYDLKEEDFKNKLFVRNYTLNANSNFVYFEYPDSTTKGKPDAIKDIEIYIRLKDGSRVLMGKIPQCHSKMERFNQEYGALSVDAVRNNEEPRMVQMRFYPSTKIIGKMKELEFVAWWDTDNDDTRDDIGRQDYRIDEIRNIEECNKFDVGDFVSLNLFRPSPFEISFEATINRDQGLFFQRYVGFTNSIDPVHGKFITDGALGEFHVQEKLFTTSGVLTGEFNPDQNPLLGVYIVFSKDNIAVLNNSANMPLSTIVISQRFVGAIQSFVLVGYPCPKNLQITRDESTFINTLNWEYSNKSFNTNEPVKIFRRKATEPEESRVLIGKGDVEKRTFTETAKVEDPFASYIYEVILSLDGWDPISTVLSAEKTIGPVATWQGDGTLASPFLIQNADDLRMLSRYAAVGYPTQNFYWKQTADIDLGGSATPWTPIGTLTDPFLGNYNGDGHVISGMYINQPDGMHLGLFGSIEGRTYPFPTISNCILKDAEIIGYKYCGTIVGLFDIGYMNDCYASATVQCNGDYIGGLIGESANAKTQNCGFAGTVNGRKNVGGLMGFNDVSVVNCFVSATVNGSDKLGAFIGTASNPPTQFQNCFYDSSAAGSLKGVSGITEDVVGLSGMPDLTGTALVGQLGISHWNFTAGQLPVLKVADKDNQFDVVLKEGVAVNDIVAEVSGVSAKCELAGENKYTTIMLPYALTTEQIEKMGRFYAYHGFYSGEGRNIVFLQEVLQTEPNKAYLFERFKGGQNMTGYALGAQNVTLQPTDKLADVSVAPVADGLYGTYKTVDIPQGGYVYVNEIEAMNELGKMSVAGIAEDLSPMNAYYWETGIPENVSEIEVMLFDHLSSVPAVIEDIRKGNDGIFNLRGQRLFEAEDGVNVINGVKVLKFKR